MPNKQSTHFHSNKTHLEGPHIYGDSLSIWRRGFPTCISFCDLLQDAVVVRRHLLLTGLWWRSIHRTIGTAMSWIWNDGGYTGRRLADTIHTEGWAHLCRGSGGGGHDHLWCWSCCCFTWGLGGTLGVTLVTVQSSFFCDGYVTTNEKR